MVLLPFAQVIASEAKQSHLGASGGDCFGARKSGLPDLRIFCCRSRVDPRSVAPRNDEGLLFRDARLVDDVAPLGDVARETVLHFLWRRRFGIDAEPAVL